MALTDPVRHRPPAPRHPHSVSQRRSFSLRWAIRISNGVDDTFLYYHFPDGRLRKDRLDSLTARVMKHDGPSS